VQVETWGLGVAAVYIRPPVEEEMAGVEQTDPGRRTAAKGAAGTPRVAAAAAVAPEVAAPVHRLVKPVSTMEPYYDFTCKMV
jgi:hypothetical protein